MQKKNWFVKFSHKISYLSGRPAAFGTALAIIAVWGVTGPIFGFNDTWQLVINTGTTIITFLMVFLIQSTQNRDTAAMHLKLDELIRAEKGTHTILLDLEELGEDELEKIRAQYEDLAAKARERIKHGKRDTNTPRIDLHKVIGEDKRD
jgi:low affinity Fe/Cu permease